VQDQRLLSRFAQGNASKLQGSGGRGRGRAWNITFKLSRKCTIKIKIWSEMFKFATTFFRFHLDTQKSWNVKSLKCYFLNFGSNWLLDEANSGYVHPPWSTCPFLPHPFHADAIDYSLISQYMLFMNVGL
jgi:hypothetical protein